LACVAEGFSSILEGELCEGNKQNQQFLELWIDEHEGRYARKLLSIQ
jgi:hypothetical protein